MLKAAFNNQVSAYVLVYGRMLQHWTCCTAFDVSDAQVFWKNTVVAVATLVAVVAFVVAAAVAAAVAIAAVDRVVATWLTIN